MRHALLFTIVGSALLIACSSDTNSTGGGGTATGNATGGSATGGNATGGNPTTGGGGTASTGGGGQGGATGGGGQGGTPGGGGQGGQGGAKTCTWQQGADPCGVGMYCDAPGCGQGVCAPITSVDDTAKVPVCGCDGVDYWNAVTASNHGMAVSSMGQCVQAAFCGGFGNLPCPDPAHFCAYDVGNAQSCNISDPGGACWGMPKTCNVIGFGGQHRTCSSPNGACLYECDAIKSGQTYWGPDNSCPQ